MHYVDAFVLIVNRVKEHPEAPVLAYNDDVTEDVVVYTSNVYPSDKKKDEVMEQQEQTHRVNYCIVEKRRVKVKVQ